MTKKKSVSFDGEPVGYKRPPVEHQFQPGQKPPGSGRKKGSKNMATIVADLMAQPMVVTDNGKKRRMPLKQALLKVAAQRAARGTLHDIVRFYDLMARLSPAEVKPELVVHFQKIPGDDW